MKPTPFKPLLFISASILVAGISLSWQTKKKGTQYQQTYTDTTPRNKNVRDLDEALQEFDSKDLQKTIDAAMKEVAEAMKQIDMKKVQAEIDKAMKEVDMTKVQKEVNEAMKSFDADKLRYHVAQAMKDIDMSKLKMEMDKVKVELKDLKPTIEKEMGKVKIEVQKIKEEQKEYKEFINKLDKEGALDKEDYTVMHRDGKLIINGKEASKKTYRKNRAFLKKHPSFKLKD